MLKKSLLTLSYLIIFLCYIVGTAVMVSFNQSNVTAQVVLKTVGALFTAIIVYYLQFKCSKKVDKKAMTVINVGFVFVVLGDFFLAFANLNDAIKATFFPFGMGAYLLGYLLFGISFYILSKVTVNFKNLLVILAVSIGIYFFYNTLNLPQELKIPLVGYCIMMIVIFTSSLFLFNKKFTGARYFSIAGILYFVSDIVVGLKEFKLDGPLSVLEYSLIIPYVLGHIFMIIAIKKYTCDN